MEDDNGLELSLGLTCGGLSAKSNGKSSSSLDIKSEGDRGNKLVDDFKSFLNPGTQKQESSSSSQRSDSLKPKESFFNDLSKAKVDTDAAMGLNGKGVWVSNNIKSSELEEEKWSEVGSKRKLPFDDMKHQKKHERESHFTDTIDKTRTSHISITTEDGSTAENEDVAESEVEGSTSRLTPHIDVGSKRTIGVGRSSDVQRDGSKAVDLNGQRRFNISSENEFRLGNAPHSSPFSAQTANLINVPYSFAMKDLNSVAAPSTSSYMVPGVMQAMPAANGDPPGTQPVNPASLPVMFGYSAIQLPTLDKDNSYVLASHPQQFHVHSSYGARGPPNSALMQVNSHNPSEAAHYDGRTVEWVKGDGKPHVTEEGSSSQAEDGKGIHTNLTAKDASDRSTAEGPYSAIKPGIAADIKFEGSGSYPNLPWVSTTGPGPNGRTISGVTYRYSPSQIRIVCACHSSHMSPEEFVRHASAEPPNSSDTGPALTTFPSSNPASSAQS